jgi:hypothetical protein
MLKHIPILPSQIDPPCRTLGFPNPSGGYNPLTDPDIPKDARGPAFAKWVSSYYKHGDLSSRDFSQLKLRDGGTSKKPTTDTILPEELLTITDFRPGTKGETFLIDSGHFFSAIIKQTTKALFDPRIREDWGGHPVWFVYGEASPWNIHYAAWNQGEKDKASEINLFQEPITLYVVYNPSIRL